MEKFRILAESIDAQVKTLEREGIYEGPTLTLAMAAHLPDLYRIWTQASDSQIGLLCDEYPHFYRFARLIEIDAASLEREDAKRRKSEFDEASRQLGELILLTSKLRNIVASVDALCAKSLLADSCSSGRSDELRSAYKNALQNFWDQKRQWMANVSRFSALNMKSDLSMEDRKDFLAALEWVAIQVRDLRASPSMDLGSLH